MKTLGIFILLLNSFSAHANTVCDESTICKNDRVNFDNDLVGTAVEVFSNGRVKIAVDGYRSYFFRSTSELGKGVRCYQGICRDNRVNFQKHVGSAIEVFTNGNVKIKVDGYRDYFFRKTSQLGRGYRCIENLCQQDRVNFEDYVGSVKEIFTNGRVKIKVDGYRDYFFRAASLLGYAIDCSDGVNSTQCHCED